MVPFVQGQAVTRFDGKLLFSGKGARVAVRPFGRGPRQGAVPELATRVGQGQGDQWLLGCHGCGGLEVSARGDWLVAVQGGQAQGVAAQRCGIGGQFGAPRGARQGRWQADPQRRIDLVGALDDEVVQCVGGTGDPKGARRRCTVGSLESQLEVHMLGVVARRRRRLVAADQRPQGTRATTDPFQIVCGQRLVVGQGEIGPHLCRGRTGDDLQAVAGAEHRSEAIRECRLHPVELAVARLIAEPENHQGRTDDRFRRCWRRRNRGGSRLPYSPAQRQHQRNPQACDEGRALSRRPLCGSGLRPMKRCQAGPQRFEGGPPRFGTRGEAAQHQPLEAGVQIRTPAAGWHRILLDPRDRGGHGGGAEKGPIPGEQVVQQNAEGVDVGGRGNRIAADLLGRHGQWRALHSRR